MAHTKTARKLARTKSARAKSVDKAIDTSLKLGMQVQRARPCALVNSRVWDYAIIARFVCSIFFFPVCVSFRAQWIRQLFKITQWFTQPSMPPGILALQTELSLSVRNLLPSHTAPYPSSSKFRSNTIPMLLKNTSVPTPCSESRGVGGKGKG